jgi:hypothetical protein
MSNMRRNHWWGATLGAGVVAGAAFLAPSALALPTPASASAPIAAKGGTSARDYHRDRDRDRGCYYPPNSSYNVVIKSASASRRNSSVSVNGSAKVGRCSFAGKTVYLYQVNKGRVGQDITDSAGKFTISFKLHSKGKGDKVEVVAFVKKDGEIGAGRSGVFKIRAPKYL